MEFGDFVADVKAASSIVEVVGETFELRRSGRFWRSVEHDSLVVDPGAGAWFWNSRGTSGDVIDWVRTQEGLGFREAVESLARRAGLEAPTWSEEGARRAAARRQREDAMTVACRWFVRQLWKGGDSPGLGYARGRGWSDETIRQAGLGWWDGDKRGLGGELDLQGVQRGDGVRAALMGMPAGMLVYPHVEHGRVVYWSTRSVEGKRHWNPPGDKVGARRVYANACYARSSERVVVVEGQADAVTLGQFGIAAIALAGVRGGGVEFTQRLLGHRVRFVGLDTDEAGENGARELAGALGPLTRVVRWPEKDVNAWLQAGAVGEECEELLLHAPTWVEVLAREAGEADGADREERLRCCFEQVARLDAFECAMRREDLAKAMGLGLRPFNAMVKAARGEAAAEEDEEEGSSPLEIAVPGGWFGEHLCEMVVMPPENGGEWSTRFAVRYPDGRIGEASGVDVGPVRYVPLSPMNRLLQERVVQFPTGIGEELELRELAERVRTVIHRYMDVDRFYEWLSTYYVLFTWLYDCFATLPYLRLLGDAGTGKSRFLQTVGPLCYRPIIATGAATTSPIFRILDRFRGTLILDEADFGRSDESAEIVKILNTGYQRMQGIVLRSGDKNKGFETEVYITYAPKVVATRKRFEDWALESRCLTYETGGPTTRGDIPIDLPRRFWTEEAPAVRNVLLRYRLRYWRPEIELDYAQAEVDSVEPRLRQVTVALLTLIDDEGLREELKAFIKEYNRQLIAERGMTLVAKVLDAIVGLQALTPLRSEWLPLKRVCEATNILIDVENEGEVQEDEEGGARRKKVTPRGIGEVVRKGLHLQTERRAAGRTYAVQWDEDRVRALRRRFGLDEEWLEQTVGVLRGNLRGVEGPPPGF